MTQQAKAHSFARPPQTVRPGRAILRNARFQADPGTRQCAANLAQKLSSASLGTGTESRTIPLHQFSPPVFGHLENGSESARTREL